MAEKNFCLRPKYLDAFKCDGNKCGALCCRSSWNIFVDAATCEKYLRLGSNVFKHLRKDGEKIFIDHDNGACPFLTADNLCGLQRDHGEDFLSQVCASYPRIITRFENFWEIALSLTCPVAARLILLQTRPLKIELTELPKKILRLGANNILQGVSQRVAPKIVDLQLMMIEILQTRSLTIRERLIALRNFLVPDMSLPNDDDLPKKNLSPEIATIAENFLVNEMLLNVWPIRLDSTVEENVRIFFAVYKIFERQILGCRTVDEILKAAGEVSRNINHDNEYLRKLGATS